MLDDFVDDEVYEYLESIPKLRHLNKKEALALGSERIAAENCAVKNVYSTDIGLLLGMKIIYEGLTHRRFAAEHHSSEGLKELYDTVACGYKANRQDYAALKNASSDEKNELREKIADRQKNLAELLSECKIVRDFWIYALKESRAIYENEHIDSYVSEPRRHALKKISAAEKAFRRYNECIEEFVNSNLRLVVNIAKKYMHYGLSIMELIEEGNIGLIDAARTYNPAFDTEFSTHASWWIKSKMRRALRDCRTFLRLPTNTLDFLKRLNHAEISFFQTYNRDPHLDEICALVGKGELLVRQLLQSRKFKFSLRIADNEDDDDSTPRPVNPAKTYQLDEQVHIKNFVHSIMKSLNKREQQVLKARCGFHGRALTFMECGNLLGMSCEGVRVAEKRALRKLVDAVNLRKYNADAFFWAGDKVSCGKLAINPKKCNKPPKTKIPLKQLSNAELAERIKSFDAAEFCAEQNL